MDCWSVISVSFNLRERNSTFSSTTFTDTSGKRLYSSSYGYLRFHIIIFAFRISIPYAFALLTIIYINPYMPKGPLSMVYGFSAQNCRDYWWVNLLYMNDFLHQDKQVTYSHFNFWFENYHCSLTVHGSYMVPSQWHANVLVCTPGNSANMEEWETRPHFVVRTFSCLHSHPRLHHWILSFWSHISNTVSFDVIKRCLFSC